jgi:TnpA family transposase
VAGLSLITAAIARWNTVYLDRVGFGRPSI